MGPRESLLPPDAQEFDVGYACGYDDAMDEMLVTPDKARKPTTLIKLVASVVVALALSSVYIAWEPLTAGAVFLAGFVAGLMFSHNAYPTTRMHPGQTRVRGERCVRIDVDEDGVAVYGGERMTLREALDAAIRDDERMTLKRELGVAIRGARALDRGNR